MTEVKMENQTTFDKDCYRTPRYVFKWLDSRFNFDMDGCADDDNHLCPHYCTESDDFLAYDPDKDSEPFIEPFYPTSIYLNPPYSNVGPFLERAKFFRDVFHCKVAVLLNNDKSTQWYQQHVHNVANEVIDIVGGRISFLHPVTGEEVKGNSKGQMVVVFDPTMEDFVQWSVSLEFIKSFG